MDDSTLLERARTGDSLAIEALYRRHAARVYSIVRRLAGDEALAEDWAQETWIRVLRALPGFRGDAQFTTWLYRVAVNSALQARRWRERRAGQEQPLEPTVMGPPVGDQPLLRVRLERALSRLPAGMREVLVLHDVEGFTHEEIAEMLGVTPGTSKSQLFKARARMRELLSPVPVAATGEGA